jgi:hypothetical protein
VASGAKMMYTDSVGGWGDLESNKHICEGVTRMLHV